MSPAIMILPMLGWTFIGLFMYMGNAHNVKKPVKKFVFSFVCGPIGWVWGIVDWCLEN